MTPLQTIVEYTRSGCEVLAVRFLRDTEQVGFFHVGKDDHRIYLGPELTTGSGIIPAGYARPILTAFSEGRIADGIRELTLAGADRLPKVVVRACTQTVQ